MSGLDEHALIARYFRPLAADPGALDLIDDAAVLSPPPGRDLVVTKDAVAENVHFLPNEAGAAVARKALRVNISDLAAMGADPLWYLVVLALPETWTEAWVADFAAGLGADQEEFRIALVGGDTIRAPALSVSVTALGAVPAGRALRRSTARAGDVLYVSGSVGDGALGLLAARGAGLPDALAPEDVASLAARYRLPQPRPVLVPALRAHAHAAIDVSDGLVGDLDKMCRASGVSATVECGRVPLSPAARRAVDRDPALFDTCLTGGDDYEILCAVPPEAAEAFEAAAGEAEVPIARIGAFLAGAGPARFFDEDGVERTFSRRAFSHTG